MSWSKSEDSGIVLIEQKEGVEVIGSRALAAYI